MENHIYIEKINENHNLDKWVINKIFRETPGINAFIQKHLFVW